MSGVTGLKRGALTPGVSWLDPRHRVAAVAAEAAERGYRAFLVDGREIADKAGCVAAISAAIGAPPSVGRNWDALEEALRDLSWAPAPGYVLVLDGADRFARTDPAGWATAVDVLRTAAARWAEIGRPFYAVAVGR